MPSISGCASSASGGPGPGLAPGCRLPGGGILGIIRHLTHGDARSRAGAARSQGCRGVGGSQGHRGTHRCLPRPWLEGLTAIIERRLCTGRAAALCLDSLIGPWHQGPELDSTQPEASCLACLLPTSVCTAGPGWDGSDSTLSGELWTHGHRAVESSRVLSKGLWPPLLESPLRSPPATSGLLSRGPWSHGS